MCGIAGILGFNKTVSKTDVKKMTDILAHRGPDGEGQWSNQTETICLGHRRLSIIDLSNSASQPMAYANGRYVITFNGEIYNYIELAQELRKNGYDFKTNSDTEVLLAMYHWKGKNMLSLLDGMFAFAIWDNETNKLFCARDRFGEKPFFYHLSKNGFYFASEMKALFAVGISSDIEKSMITNYLFNDLVDYPGNETTTFYSSVQKLEKGTYIEVDQNQHVEKKQYYQIEIAQNKLNLTDATDKFYELLAHSVNKRMRSDVKIGSSLSGGLDSSALVYLIKQNLLATKSQNSNTTFSARFHEEGFSENEFLDCVLSDLQVENHSIYPNEHLVHEELQSVFYHQEEPFLSASILNQWDVMRLANQKATVVLLDGQGADEMLAGYKWYQKVHLIELYSTSKKLYREEIENRAKNGFSPIKIEFIDWLKINFKSGVNSAAKIRAYSFKKWGFNALSPNALWYGILNKEFCDISKVDLPFVKSYPNNLNEVLKQDYTLILESLLRYSDRNSMAFSREVRMPFLNHELVNFCFSLDSSFKIHEGWKKFILRKSFENKLPDKITWRKDKMGYAAPEEKWLSAPKNQEFISDSWQDLKNKKIINSEIQLEPKMAWKMLMLNSITNFSKSNFTAKSSTYIE